MLGISLCVIQPIGCPNLRPNLLAPARCAGSPLFDAWARKATYRILNEDKVMVEKLKPDQMPAEFSLQPDRPQVRQQ